MSFFKQRRSTFNTSPNLKVDYGRV